MMICQSFCFEKAHHFRQTPFAAQRNQADRQQEMRPQVAGQKQGSGRMRNSSSMPAKKPIADVQCASALRKCAQKSCLPAKSCLAFGRGLSMASGSTEYRQHGGLHWPRWPRMDADLVSATPTSSAREQQPDTTKIILHHDKTCDRSALPSPEYFFFLSSLSFLVRREDLTKKRSAVRAAKHTDERATERLEHPLNRTGGSHRPHITPEDCR